MVNRITPPFASHLNFLDPQFDSEGKPWGPQRYKQLVRECWYITKNVHTSYNEVLKMNPTERKTLLDFISEDNKKRQESLDKALSKNKK